MMLTGELSSHVKIRNNQHIIFRRWDGLTVFDLPRHTVALVRAPLKVALQGGRGLADKYAKAINALRGLASNIAAGRRPDSLIGNAARLLGHRLGVIGFDFAGGMGDELTAAGKGAFPFLIGCLAQRVAAVAAITDEEVSN